VGVVYDVLGNGRAIDKDRPWPKRIAFPASIC
jgi:hypothetical protein